MNGAQITQTQQRLEQLIAQLLSICGKNEAMQIIKALLMPHNIREVSAMPEHKYTDFAICPYCGYEDYDIWELGLSDGETTQTCCVNCGKIFAVTAHVTVQYSTFPVNEVSINKKEG